MDFILNRKKETDNLITDCKQAKWDDKKYFQFVSATNKILTEINAGLSHLFQSQTAVYVIDDLISALYEYEQLKNAFAAI